jgi:hypothetical protein
MSRFQGFGLFASGFAVACLGCATKSLPPGTPPPEYEKRTLEPWPPKPLLDAGTEEAGTPPVTSGEPAPTEPLAPPSDAGAG